MLNQNLPTHVKATVTTLPEFAEKSGDIYFIADENNVPIGIALSGEDKRIQFYSVMQAAEDDTAALSTFDELTERKNTATAITINSDGSINEILRNKTTNALIATRKTAFSSDNKTITETIQLYEADGATVESQTVITTVIDSNSSITKNVV